VSHPRRSALWRDSDPGLMPWAKLFRTSGADEGWEEQKEVRNECASGLFGRPWVGLQVAGAGYEFFQFAFD
jgi:hypothetical protein